MDLSTLSRLRHSRARIIFAIKLHTTLLITTHIMRNAISSIVKPYALIITAVIIRTTASIISMHVSQQFAPKHWVKCPFHQQSRQHSSLQ